MTTDELVPSHDEAAGIVDGEHSLVAFQAVFDKALGLPGVKVNRTKMLMDAYGLSKAEAQADDVFMGVSLEQMDKAASQWIAKNVTATGATAFMLGLPGGFAMAATIPADVLQNFAFSLRLAQQIAYIYGFDDLFDDGDLTDSGRSQIMAFLGIMFAVNGSGAVLRAIAPNVGRYLAKQAMAKPLTKTMWYPALQKITRVVAARTITKRGVASFATKAVPVFGGVLSGGLTIAIMIPMANRLKAELRKYHLSELELEELAQTDKKTFADSAGDAIATAAAGAIQASRSVKNIGKGAVSFTRSVAEKTKAKLHDH